MRSAERYCPQHKGVAWRQRAGAREFPQDYAQTSALGDDAASEGVDEYAAHRAVADLVTMKVLETV